MKIEMHVHTKFSKDSLLGFAPLYWKCKKKNIQVLAITEHNNIQGAEKFREFCARHNTPAYHLQVIIGEEIYSRDGEIIGLFLKKQIEPGLSAAETIRQIKEQGGLVYIPHPYDEKRYRTVLKEKAIAENKCRIDCMEIHNGRNVSPFYDQKQEALAKKYGIRPVIGSDAHTWMEIGRNYMVSDQREIGSPEELCRVLEQARFHKAEYLKISHSITAIVKLFRLLKTGEFHEIYRAVIRKIKSYEHRSSIQN